MVNIHKYPFSEEAHSVINNKYEKASLLITENEEALEVVKAIITDALKGKPIIKESIPTDEGSMVVWLLCRMIPLLLNNKYLAYKVSNLFSKYYGKLFQREPVDRLIELAFDLGYVFIKTEPNEIHSIFVPYVAKIHFVDYTKISAKFQSPSWKLVNARITGGFVFLKKSALARILEEILKDKMMGVWDKEMDVETRDNLINEMRAIPVLKSIYEKLRQKDKYYRAKIERFKTDKLELDEECYPPCINRILFLNKSGINLTHNMRLFLTYFLVNVGKSTEEIISIFKLQPDYNESVTRYHVEYAAGLHGGTKYWPHNCSKLQSLNMCEKESLKDCREPRYPFKNPITLYKRLIGKKKWIESKKEETEK